jgi:SsrA-binding protein
MKSLVKNSKGLFDYDLKEHLTAGLVLSGPEVKSAKRGDVSLAGSYVTINATEAWLVNCHIGPYPYAVNKGYEPTQRRKLLLKKGEINSLLGKEKGLVIIPVELFIGDNGRIKLHVGIGRARKKVDKREYIKKRDIDREIRQAQKS